MSYTHREHAYCDLHFVFEKPAAWAPSTRAMCKDSVVSLVQYNVLNVPVSSCTESTSSFRTLQAACIASLAGGPDGMLPFGCMVRDIGVLYCNFLSFRS